MTKSLLKTLFVLAAAGLPLSAQTAVVASTSWTAAFARAAGARDITLIAPFELRHPPEYEIKPSDLEAVRNARLVVYAGYERFASRLAETTAGAGVAVVQIQTDNSPETIKAQAARIAQALGTSAQFREWAAGFDRFAAGIRAEVMQAYPRRRAVVQRFQRSFAEWLGFEVVGVFGPGEPSPAVVLELTRLRPDLVIDNYHNPSGRAMAESLRIPYADLINFPGRGGTVTFEDIYTFNARLLIDAARR